jgi:hypothetical protein
MQIQKFKIKIYFISIVTKNQLCFSPIILQIQKFKIKIYFSSKVTKSQKSFNPILLQILKFQVKIYKMLIEIKKLIISQI